MREKLLNLLVKLYLRLRCLAALRCQVWGIAAFLTFAVTGYTLVWMGFERLEAIKNIRQEIVRLQSSLNEVGYDIAYEDLSFSSFNPFQIMSVKNFQLYSLYEGRHWVWLLPELSLRVGLFNSCKITVNLPAGQLLEKGADKYTLTMPEVSLEIRTDKENRLKQMVLLAKNIKISDVADIGELQIASRRMAPQQLSELAPFFENYIDVRNVTFNALFDYPQAQTIERLYLNADIIGTIYGGSTYKNDLENWKTLGGGIDVRRLVVNWGPLLLVARGDVFFDKQQVPYLHLRSSSKALNEFLDELLNKGWLESKGVFVAKILLNSKAFKMNRDDKFMTVTTPIDYKDGKLMIENIVVKDLTQPQEQKPGEAVNAPVN